MAPEQPNQLDSRTDLYSLGASLYLMLTERLLEKEWLPAGYVQKHLTTEPTPPSTHVAMIPTDLETACLRLLQKSPDDRFASANHLLQYISLSTRIIRNRRLFGRAQEMHQLQENVATLARGQGGIVLLEGRHGMAVLVYYRAHKNCSKTSAYPLTFAIVIHRNSLCMTPSKACSTSSQTQIEQAFWYVKIAIVMIVGKSIPCCETIWKINNSDVYLSTI